MSTNSFYVYKNNMTNVTTSIILKVISKSKTRIDVCSDYKMPKSLTFLFLDIQRVQGTKL